MGVKDLQTVMEQHCPDGSKVVKIEDLVREYRALHGGNTVPTIVVDGCGCIRKLYGNLCWVVGGQWKEFVGIVEDFIERFERIGIKLIFFFDGIVMPDKRPIWVKRRLQTMEKTNEVFAAIRAGRIPSRNHIHFPYGITNIFQLALKLIYKCEVFNSRKDCDQEIATYARKNNCLAILAQDSDFVIFDTAPYLSLSHLDLFTMSTVHYDRCALATWLDLRISQLPLFASLCGNDTIPFYWLEDFHCYINDPLNLGLISPRLVKDVARNVKAVAVFVRLQWNVENYTDLSTIAQIALNDVRKADLLNKSICTYITNYGDDAQPCGLSDIMELVISRHVNSENTAFVFNALYFATFDSSNALEENTHSRFPAVSLLYRIVRQRCYYILQTARDPKNKLKIVEEWCAYPGNSLVAPEEVKPMPCTLPSGGGTLRDLWSLPRPRPWWVPRWLPRLHSTRFKLEALLEAFLICFGVTFDYGNDYVPQNYFIFCCVVNFLSRNTKIRVWEIDALIAQAIILNSTSVEFLQRIKIDKYDADAVNLATVFVYGVNTALAVLSTCSYPVNAKFAMPWNFFDGKLFHHCYRIAATSKKTNFRIDYIKPIDWNFFDIIKRMCLSKKTSA